ncbi:MAG: hypothetical protein R3A46_19285 [Thermomicrobiales bacterium]
MQLQSITSAGHISSFRVRQSIVTSYRDMQDANSTTSMLIEARKDPPAIQTTLSTDGGPPIITLIVPNGLWQRAGDGWTRSDIGDVPEGWALRAYREIGDMSLAAPVSAQAVIDAGSERGSETVGGISLTRYGAGTELMLRLSQEAGEAQNRGEHPAGWAAAPLDGSFTNRFEADLWVDSETGFVIRERTVVEYTEERLHGQDLGTGPAIFTTTREFFDLNAEIGLESPTG